MKRALTGNAPDNSAFASMPLAQYLVKNGRWATLAAFRHAELSGPQECRMRSSRQIVC
jgi:hypothetical protein